MEEKNDLKRQYARILAKYSNTKYATLTKDYSLTKIPDRLLSLWYSPMSVSVVALMNSKALTQRNLDSLEENLHNEFKKLEKKYNRN